MGVHHVESRFVWPVWRAGKWLPHQSSSEVRVLHLVLGALGKWKHMLTLKAAKEF